MKEAWMRPYARTGRGSEEPIRRIDGARTAHVSLLGRGSWAAIAFLVTIGSSASADPIRHVWRTAPRLVGLPGLAADERYQNAADVILEQAARNLPIHPAASSAYTYRWNAELGRIE